MEDLFDMSPQGLIDSGNAWRLEGSVGRECMRALECGACHLPKVSHRDAYGNRVPAYFMVAPGSTGSVELWAEHHDLPEGTLPEGFDAAADMAAWEANPS
jgi:hypothetical protein